MGTPALNDSEWTRLETFGDVCEGILLDMSNSPLGGFSVGSTGPTRCVATVQASRALFCKLCSCLRTSGLIVPQDANNHSAACVMYLLLLLPTFLALDFYTSELCPVRSVLCSCFEDSSMLGPFVFHLQVSSIPILFKYVPQDMDRLLYCVFFGSIDAPTDDLLHRSSPSETLRYLVDEVFSAFRYGGIIAYVLSTCHSWA